MTAARVTWRRDCYLRSVALCDIALWGGPPLSRWSLRGADHVRPGADLPLASLLQYALATAGYHFPFLLYFFLFLPAPLFLLIVKVPVKCASIFTHKESPLKLFLFPL